MSHLDEGTLHALLDGELDLAEVREIQTHLGTCTACDSRLQDVKQFLAEADRLVGALETPAGSTKALREPASTPPARPFAPSREPQAWEPAPELLLPDSGENVNRARWMRAFRWAAMILVVFGVGRMIQGALRPDDSMLELSTRDEASPSTPPAVVSPVETVRPESRPPRESRSAPAPANRTRTAKAAPQSKVLADQPAAAPLSTDEELDTAGAASEDSAVAPRDTQTLAAARGGVSAAEAEDQDLATRQAAAAALEELDRERLRSRANAATASLPPPRTEVQPAAETPPAPRTLEQRAQVYLRIGLDEAVAQLGRPVHVIEAMSPEFIGLTPGRQVPGADPNRPVVRVVYQDRGRMILLDQQRLRTGQAPGASAGNLRWTQGDVMLYLHGEPGPEVLRNLQRRVR
ncbi:MAG: zf-HC2 domain-containing protein [Gemmatimonadota bacterium]|nr:zf-HC2 domain-containing protein [Gemmatimonadota bacterium]